MASVSERVGYAEVVMRRYPFAVPGLVRLTASGGSGLVSRIRATMEPLVMAILHRFDSESAVRAFTTDELDTREGEEFPKEWWIRTAFVPAASPDPAVAKERAWMTIEYSRWEEAEDWSFQAFFRVADVEFSLAADSDQTDPVVNLVGSRLPAGDLRMIEEVIRAHLGGQDSSKAAPRGVYAESGLI